MEMEEESHENLNMSIASNEDMFASSEESDIAPSNDKLVEAGNSKSEDPEMLNKDWRGLPIEKLKINIGQNLFPPVLPGPQHSVHFQLPVRDGEVPRAWPVKSSDVWDQNHVRLPHSSYSLYPVTSSELRRRWELVEESLKTPINTSRQLQEAILHYNSKYNDRWNFRVLHSFFSQALEEEETTYFFKKVLPKIIDLALSLPRVVTGGVPLLRQHQTRSISLSQHQISCLLANAFLCTFPRRNTTKKDSEYSSFPYINFNRLFNGDFAKDDRIPCIHEKLKCLINYFRRVTNKVPDGVVTYSRHSVSTEQLPQWSNQSAKLPNLYISSEGTIEDQGYGMLQMDFANNMVGGGVLGRGCVQEEIRFVICPELILARLFTEVLSDTEALVINGCERFSLYRGYSDNFEWAGNYEDQTPKDRFGRRYCTVVAVDATRFPNPRVQYSIESINRELNKAFAGFSWGMKNAEHEAVATGNWGCGAFKGDACLKSLLQLMAAGVAGRDVAYFTFGNNQLRDQVANIHSFLQQHQMTVGRLWEILTSFSPLHPSHNLYDYIFKAVNGESISSNLRCKAVLSSEKKNIKEKDQVKQTKMPIKDNDDLKLSVEEIQLELWESERDSLESEDKLEGVKPLEAKTLHVQNDKELCLKRLNSSWNNLNDSKKDFGPSGPLRTCELSCDTEQSKDSQTSNITKKKKISDYFQPASKS